jgi:signal transduction histidine kinase
MPWQRFSWLRSKFSPKSSLFWTLLVSASALCVVALLQYRWTSQVSEVSEGRIGSDLQSRMMDWHLDLYQEFAGICVALQVGPDSGAQDGWNAYAQRYSEWHRTSAAANLVKGVYVSESSRPPNPRFLRMIPETSRIESETLPAELEPLLARLQANSTSLAAALNAWRRRTPPSRSSSAKGLGARNVPRSDTMTGWQFDSAVPAIVHPIFHHENPYENPRFSDLFALYRREKSLGTQDAVDWIIVVLDRDNIEKQALPALTNRYFREHGVLAYKVAVTTSREQRVLYSSDPDFPGSEPTQADAIMNIFGPPPESTEGHFWQAVQRAESLRLEDWRSFAGPVWFPVIEHDSGSAPWVLAVRRRGDPLEVVLARTRRRNLAVSGGVLLLLALSMGLVLIAGHRAQRLARLQMDFVAAVSHELRTPLTVICSAAENIVDGLVDSKQQLTRYGSVIRNQGRQLAGLVDQVLLFASTQEGKSRYQLRPLEVAEILKVVLSNTSALADRSGVTIHQEIVTDLPPVMGDLPAVSQCLQNLIVNAIKYSGDSRWIGIRACWEDSGGRAEVRISVQDKGIGINSADLPHIFEPFYRSAQVEAAQIHGTGLGLTLARRIADAMGGRLTVNSKAGAGSVFTLHLVPATGRDVSSETVARSNTQG